MIEQMIRRIGEQEFFIDPTTNKVYVSRDYCLQEVAADIFKTDSELASMIDDLLKQQIIEEVADVQAWKTALHHEAQQKRIPISCTFELTQKCNFLCSHCYCSYKKASHLSLSEVKKIVDGLVEKGCLSLWLTGGEITTRKDFLEIYGYIKQKGFFVYLLTNGSNIDSSLIEIFKQLPPMGINISLYGMSPEDYEVHTGKRENYGKVMTSMRRLKEAGIPFEIKAMAMESTKEAIENGDFQSLADQFCTSFEYGTYIIPENNGERNPVSMRLSPEELVRLEDGDEKRGAHWAKRVVSKKTKAQFRCTAGVNSFFINYKGDASLCAIYRNHPFSILNGTVTDAWNLLKQEHKALEKVYLTSQCGACEHEHLCRWCPAYSILENGVNNKPIDYLCNIVEKRLELYSDTIDR